MWPSRGLSAYLLCSRRRSLVHDDLGPQFGAAVKIDHILVSKPDTARGNRMSDGPWLRRAMNAVFGGAEIKGPRAQRVTWPPFHVVRQIGLAVQHFWRRMPVGPFGFAADMLSALPGEAHAADADAVTQRLAVGEDQIEEAAPGFDDDRSRLLA